MTSLNRVGIPLAAVVSAVALAACGAPSTANSSAKQADLTTPKEKSGTLTMVTKFADPKYAPYFVDVAKAYEAANPGVKIQLEQVGDQPYKDKIRVLSASKKLPDIYFSWAGDFANKFVRAGLAADLTSRHRTRHGVGQDLLPGRAQGVRARGQELRRARSTSTPSTWPTTSAAFTKAGINEPPDSLEDAAGRLRQAEVRGLHPDRASATSTAGPRSTTSPSSTPTTSQPDTLAKDYDPGHGRVHRPRLRQGA